MGQRPFAIDPAGRDIHGEADVLRSRGSVAAAELRGGNRAWAPTGHHVLKQPLADGRVSKTPTRTGRIEGWFRDAWINSWVGVTNMITAYGPDHRRPRKLIPVRMGAMGSYYFFL
ncbi:hypothetical protein [Streptomyces atroolivaceus]|uniref:hypothetical protein n=1 Tax=Streptomyces atroolivaceus TaxID=66869 RepID=UPI0037A43059